ncbi:MAG: sigma-70 family RNA polymerase sigma factor [Oscillospiraceae bacterium]|nr:sigma-70 family RNA polymerase sigma factor [Oscillospiraceae bacterium]
MDEKTLVELCKKGDRSAFNELVLKYQSKVVNIAYGMLSVREDAEDAAQDVFIKVYKNIASFKGDSAFSTWIYRITANTCNDILRKRMNKKTISIHSSDEDGDSSDMIIPDSAPPPEKQAEIKETQREVRAAISALKDEYRTVITLFDLEGLSYEEIADISRLPIGTVKSRLNRARAQLRKSLEHLKENTR